MEGKTRFKRFNPQEAIAWNAAIDTYSVGSRIDLVTNCFAFMFTNIGDTIAAVNGMVIFPSATPLTALGDSRTVGAHENEIYKGNITLSFPGALGANPLVEIVQLFYLTDV